MSPDVLDRTAGPASGSSTCTELAETEQVVRHLSARRRRHAALVVVGLAVVLVTVMAVRVLLGRYTVTIPDFIAILGGATIPGATFVVMEDKLPRAFLGAPAGAPGSSANASCSAEWPSPPSAPRWSPSSSRGSR